MIAFGCSITKPDQFRRCAEPGIRRAAEADSVRYELPAAGSIARSYNALLDRAAERDDLEALVLLHQDAEIVDADLCAKVRAALSDPDVAVVGLRRRARRPQHRLVGGVGDARLLHQPLRGVTAAATCTRSRGPGRTRPPWAQTGEVETLDGFVLALSPWAVRNIRFDESLSRFHGYDLDYCLQVREAGRKVVTADFRAIHHREIEMLPDPEEWIEAHINVAEKWDGRMPGIGTAPGSWRERALRAEAERDAAAADGAHAGARARGARPRARARPRRDAREPVLAPQRPAAVGGAVADAGGPADARAALRPMIAFGSTIVDPEAYRRFAAAGHPARGRAGLRGARVRGRRQHVPRLQPAARQRRGAMTTSRRS